MARYISCADTAKLVRKMLKQHFPGIKFSVRSDVYAGGASISVRWIDGPTRTDVECVAHQFKGATFDGMIDLLSHHTSELDGEEVRFGADFISCSRDYSPAFIEALVPQFCERFGVDPSHVQIKSNGKVAYATFQSAYLDECFNELRYNTDEKDMYRAYEAQEEAESREQAEWEAGAAERARQAEETRKRDEAEEKARREREQQEEAAKARQQEQERQRDARKFAQYMILSSREAAMIYLDVPSAASAEDITRAFRKKVKAAADGHGGYTIDMDFLVKVKEKALGQ